MRVRVRVRVRVRIGVRIRVRVRVRVGVGVRVRAWIPSWLQLLEQLRVVGFTVSNMLPCISV